MTSPVEALRSLRNAVVEDRRELVSRILETPSLARDVAHDLMFLQGVLDASEAAIAHEQHLARPHAAWMPPSPGGPPPRR